MARLSIVIALASVGLQFLYLAQSLIVVDHSKAFRKGSSNCHIARIPIRQPWIGSALWERGDGDEMEEFVPPVEQLGERNRQIQDRIRKRENRSRKNKRSNVDREFDNVSSDTRQTRRRQRQERIPKGSMVDDFRNEKPATDRDYANDIDGEETRQRRLRRRERFEQRPPSLFDSISSSPIVNDVIDYGSRAGRIAQKKTGQLWDDLVDSTYSDSAIDEENYFDTSTRQSRRERRRSGFKWQQKSRRPMRRTSRRRQSPESFSSTGEKSRNSNSASENFSPSYYYSDKDPAASRGKDLRTQEEASEEAEQRQVQRNQNLQPFSRTAPEDIVDTKAPSSSDMRSEAQKGKLPIGQILLALDERNISYSPRASRKELEDLLLDVLGDNDAVAVKNAEEDNIQVIEVESISPEDWQRQQEAKLLQKQKELQREQEEKRKKQRQKRQKQQQQQQQQANKNESNSPQKGSSKTRAAVNRSYRPSGFSSTATKAYGGGSSSARERRRKQSQPTSRERDNSGSPPPSRSRTSGSPENPSGSQNKTETKRRIYSPFGNRRSEPSREATQSRPSSRASRRMKEEFGDIRGDFDRFGDVVENDLGRFGDILANSVDNIFWGPGDERRTENSEQEMDDDDDDDDDDVNEEDDEYPNNRRNRRRKRHWKDRAEERLDKMMGVHKVGGKTYDRWTEQDSLEAEEEEASGYDAVSYTRGRKRRNRRRQRSREESIFSTLLDNSWDDSPQRSLQNNLDDVFRAFRSSRSLTALLRNLLVLSVNFITTLSKWASVRDTIPRPVVFLGGVGAGFVSRPGSRIKNSLIVFLCFRVLGEWLSEPTRTYSRKPPPRSPRRQEQRRRRSSDKVGEEIGEEEKNRGDNKKKSTDTSD